MHPLAVPSSLVGARQLSCQRPQRSHLPRSPTKVMALSRQNATCTTSHYITLHNAGTAQRTACMGDEALQWRALFWACVAAPGSAGPQQHPQPPSHQHTQAQGPGRPPTQNQKMSP